MEKPEKYTLKAGYKFEVNGNKIIKAEKNDNPNNNTLGNIIRWMALSKKSRLKYRLINKFKHVY